MGCIHNNGGGIPPAARDKVFMPFFTIKVRRFFQRSLIIELYQKMGISSFHIGVKDHSQGIFRKMDILSALLLSPIANTGQQKNGQTPNWIKQTLIAEKDVLYRFINDYRLRWRRMDDCHSRDFDALIAHTSVSMIAYNMFSICQTAG